MSKLAKRPIIKKKNVEVKLSQNCVEAKGPHGTDRVEIPVGICVDISDVEVQVSANEKLEKYSFLGLYHALISNLIHGVTDGFEKKLELKGVGYRAIAKGHELELSLGFSHPCNVKVPEGIKVDVEKNVNIIIRGHNKQKVGQFAADVRALRPPEPYKGKGVLYAGEVIRRKAGKTSK